MGFLDFDKKKDPYYKENKLLTMILKSYITTARDVNDKSENCQLVVKGIIPPLQVDLCGNCYDGLTILDTTESHSSNNKTGPVKVVDSGMYIHSCVRS